MLWRLLLDLLGREGASREQEEGSADNCANSDVHEFVSHLVSGAVAIRLDKPRIVPNATVKQPRLNMEMSDMSDLLKIIFRVRPAKASECKRGAASLE